MHVRVTDNYQIEIPKSIIKALNIKIGDNLLIYKDKEEMRIKRAKYSLKDLKGLGKEIWKDIDVDKYIEEERESW
ncbi:MAG: AbrB/MazE/SpoVT family DNA-binding domain-containing protein [Methanosarcinales archaeon]